MIYIARNPYTGRLTVVLGWRGFCDLFWSTPRKTGGLQKKSAGLRNSNLFVGVHLCGRLYTATIERRP